MISSHSAVFVDYRNWAPWSEKHCSMTFGCIDRCALLAWDPKHAETSLVACGSVSRHDEKETGQNFALELFSIGQECRLVGHEQVSASFSRLIWTTAESNSVIVGGLADGSISIWNSQQLASGNPSLQKTVNLYGRAVGGLAHSPFQGNLIVSGANFGQIHLWDLNRADKQSELSFGELGSSFIQDMAWNRKVPHIVAVASCAGQLSVLDLRSKKAVINLTLPDSHSVASSISWNPESPTSILTGSDNDSAPLLYLWDLKCAGAPQKTLSGHLSGVLSTCWSSFDSNTILSASRDGAVLEWSAESGKVIKQLEKRSEGVFNVSWSPTDPDVLASCGLDGRINFLSYQDSATETGLAKVADSEATPVATETGSLPPYNEHQRPPPIGAIFGPGSVCSIFRAGRRDVALVKIVSDESKSVLEQVSEFESLLNSTDAATVCNSLVESNPNAPAWKLVSLLFGQDFNSELLYFIDAVHHQYPDFHGSKHNQVATDDLLKSVSCYRDVDDIDQVISDNLVAFNIYDAVAACLSADRFSDALIIASLRGPELREEVESFILQNSSTNNYMRICCALRYQDFSELINNSSSSDWKQVLSLLIHHSNPEGFSELCLRLADRLSSDSESRIGAATSYLMAGDLYKYAEQLLKEFLKISSDDTDLKVQFTTVFDAYRLIRLLQVYSYGFLNSISDENLKSIIFDVVVRMKYILYISGSDSEVTEDFSQFSAQFIGKDLNLDLVIEKLFTSSETMPDEPVQDHNSQELTQPQSFQHSLESTQSYAAAYANPLQPIQAHPGLVHQSSQDVQTPFTAASVPVISLPPQAIKPNPPISPTWSPEGSPKTYNDAPIIKPRGSALVPDITSQIAAVGLSDLDKDQISNAIQALISTADQKSQGVQKKMVADWGSKLTAEVVCAGTYEPSVQASVATLFKEIGICNWEVAGSITSWLITSHFTETKNWILNFKRLLEVAKY